MAEFDNTNNSPEAGQEEVSAESREDVMEELGEVGFEEETEEQPQEEVQESTEEQRKLADKFDSPEQLEKAYKELESKLGQRDKETQEKIKQLENLQKVAQQNPAVGKALQLAMRDPDFSKAVDLYEQGYLSKDKLQKAYQMIQQKQQSQQQQINPESVQQMISQEVGKAQQLFHVQSNMQREFDNLKQGEYKEIIDKHNIDFEPLAEYAVKHNLLNEEGIPSMQKALNHFAIDKGPDIFKSLINMGKNEVTKSQKQALNAQVESSTSRQTDSSDKGKDEIVDGIMEYVGTSGGGIT